VRRVGLLLAKDLRILARSPLVLTAFLVYPLLIAALVGIVVRYAGERPRVAFVDRDGLPQELVVGGQRFDVGQVLAQVEHEVDLIPLSEADAAARLAAGRVVAEIVVPQGFASEVRGLVKSPTLVLRTGRGELAGRVALEMEALVYRLNRLLQERYIAANLGYVDLLLEGGKGEFVGNDFDVIGLKRAGVILGELRARTSDPEEVRRIEELQIFVREAILAVGQTGTALRSVANPIELDTQRPAGRTWLLSAQVQAYAFALTLAFVCVLLAAASVASERDENTLGRLARGLVRLRELVAEKISFATSIGVALGAVLAVVFGLVIEVADLGGGEPWRRIPLLLVGLLLAAGAVAAFGAVVGALAREARTASLAGFLVALPLVLVGLVPEGVSPVTDWASKAFPLGHGVRFFESALYDADPWGLLGREAAWLVGLGAVYGAAAWAGVRRFLIS
jgi:ABC-2 type transport system permease protein